ncbi:MAG: hypothetical protein KDB94_06250 [Acidobacteria bacterium]|nr:hypothetical protein [Acidobacteriota bacterium]MCB9378622.1 hypothetical protein [Holophagales bacterium]
MKLAVGTADGRRLFAAHFGESPEFLVIDLDLPGEAGHERRPNPWHAEPIATRPPKIAALLADCDAIAVRSIAKEGLETLSRRFTVLLAPGDEVAALLAALERDGVAALRRFDRERGKFVAGGD